MRHILLVEDNSRDVLLIREAIRTSSVNADVLVAYDGETALQILAEIDLRLDLVIFDLGLPDLEGLEILKRYRIAEGLPVVVFTVSTNPADRNTAIAVGVKEYVVKPAERDAYIAAIHGVLERWLTKNHRAANGG